MNTGMNGKRLYVLCDPHETEKMRVGTFIAGLREEIWDRLMTTPDLTVHLASLHAIEIERQVNKSANSQVRNTRTYAPRNTSSLTAPRREIQSTGPRASTTRTETNTNLKDIECFKCNGRGHYKRDCPNARAFTMREWNDIRQNTNPTHPILVMRMAHIWKMSMEIGTLLKETLRKRKRET